jgi:hypothetical protein
MKEVRGALLIAVVLTAATGCTTTKVIQSTASPAAQAEVNARLASRNADVRTTNGQAYTLYNVQLQGDSVVGMSPFGGGPGLFTIEEVFEIKTSKDRTAGGVVGALIGAGVGVAMGLASYSSREQCYVCTKGEYTGVMTVGGAMWGVLIGAIRGNRTKYTIVR